MTGKLKKRKNFAAKIPFPKEVMDESRPVQVSFGGDPAAGSNWVPSYLREWSDRNSLLPALGEKEDDPISFLPAKAIRLRNRRGSTGSQAEGRPWSRIWPNVGRWGIRR